MQRQTQLANDLWPLLLPRIQAMIAGATGGGGSAATNLAAHDLGGSLHTGTLRDSQAPQFLMHSGARPLTGSLAVDAGVTIDGVDISAHAADPNAHHATATVTAPLTIVGQIIGLLRETNSGLTIGGANGLALGTPGTLGVSSASGVTGTSHNHAVDWSSSPGAASKLLGTDASGYLNLVRLTLTDRLSSPLIDTASGNLLLKPASNVVALPSAVAVQTDNYASQLTGWRATYAGEADFRYLFVDEMHAKSFIADLEQALAGGQIICKSVAMVATTFTAPAASGTATLRVRDLPSAANMAVFESGDIVRLRVFSRSGGSLTIADCWGSVTGYADQTDGTQTWTFTRSAAPNAGTMTAGTTVAPDAIVLDYGTSGNGYYEVNAIDGAYGLNSPYARIATWTTHPATGTTLRAQFGNLRGVYGYSGTEFGVAMGSPTGANVTSDATNGVRLRQGTNDTIVLAPSGSSYFAGVMTIGASGEIRQGTGTLGSNYTGLRVWHDSNVGRIGGYNNNLLQWYGATDGRLYAGAGAVELGANGERIYRPTWYDTNGIPEPGYGTNPNTAPTAAQALEFIDTAQTFSVVGPPHSYSYPAQTIMQMYVSSKHLVPYSNPGFWEHYLDGVIEVKAMTNIGDNSTRTSRLWLKAPNIYLDGPAVGLSTVQATMLRLSSSKVLSDSQVYFQTLNQGAWQYIGARGISLVDGTVYTAQANGFEFLDGSGNRQRINAAAAAIYTPSATAWAGGIFTTANAATYGYFDYYYGAYRSGYMIWYADKIQLVSDNNCHINLIPNGTGKIGINTAAPGYLFDVNGESRFAGTVRSEVAFSLLPVSTPATSALYYVIFLDSADGKLKYKTTGGTVRTLSYT